MSNAERHPADDIREANILLLMLAREAVNRDMKSAMMQWGFSSRLAQRLARLGPSDIQALGSVPEPLFRLADTDAFFSAIARIEGLETVEKIEIAQLSHMASGPVHSGS